MLSLIFVLTVLRFSDVYQRDFSLNINPQLIISAINNLKMESTEPCHELDGWRPDVMIRIHQSTINCR